MKSLASLLILLFAVASGLRAADAAAPAAPLASGVFHWDKIQLQPTATGARSTVFEAPTVTLDKFHCHVSRLNPGQNTGAPHRHPQEELVLVKEGTLEANINGRIETVETGSMVFYSANELENMRNPGSVPAVYYVFQVYTPATPKP
jgi:XRE family transcriptional regulator, regulator of sulfur utilization